MIKNRILLIICFCAVSLFSSHLLGVPSRFIKLPYANEKESNYSFYSLSGLPVGCYGWTNIHLSQWKDIQLTPDIQKNPRWPMYDYTNMFETNTDKFSLGIYQVGLDPVKVLLYTASLDNSQLISAITIGAATSTPCYHHYIELMQYAISADYEVTVYTLLPLSDVPIIADDLFLSRNTPIRAQRIDTTYKIDDEGYFHQINEVRYFPQTYCTYQFVGKHYNVWDGYETVQWLDMKYTFKPPYEIYF